MERNSTSTIVIYISLLALFLFLIHLADDIRRQEIVPQFGTFAKGLMYYGLIFIVWTIALVLIYRNKLKTGMFITLFMSVFVGVPTLMVHVLGSGSYSFTKISQSSGFIFAFIALLLALASLGVFVLSIICLVNLRRKKPKNTIIQQ